MRLLILGGTGMLGHKLWQCLSPQFETFVSVRDKSHPGVPLFRPDRTVSGTDASQFCTVTRAITTLRPDTVINCIGIIKQSPAITDPVAAITVNALFPHQLSLLCRQVGSRLIHVSTDCVFSGARGTYSEGDPADPQDPYGRTKLLGEVREAGCLTIRTSIIGRELRGESGLVEWLLSQAGRHVYGFQNAIFSGVTTRAMAELIGNTVLKLPQLSGLYHVSSSPISKFELLCKLRDAYRLDVDISPQVDPRIDRSLDCTRFRAETGFTPPLWDNMIDDMVSDPTPYRAWRNIDGPGR